MIFKQVYTAYNIHSITSRTQIKAAFKITNRAHLHIVIGHISYFNKILNYVKYNLLAAANNEVIAVFITRAYSIDKVGLVSTSA